MNDLESVQMWENTDQKKLCIWILFTQLEGSLADISILLFFPLTRKKLLELHYTDTIIIIVTIENKIMQLNSVFFDVFVHAQIGHG